MESRSWTHLSSNVTRLEGIRLGDHLESLLTQGGAPSELLLSCVHEFTHHWCFLSSVGLALTGLTNRMARTSLRDDVPGQTWAVARDLVAYRTATEALRPLAEGLALFAEFDVVSITARISSTPLKSAALLFSGRLQDKYTMTDDGDLVRSAPASNDLLAMSLPILLKLRRARLSEDGMRRKAHVLASGIDADQDGYLLGYLAVKGMWRVIRQRCPRLYSETDLAMAYLMTFFYEDMRLVEILLAADTSENEVTLATAILQRFSDRTEALSDVTDDDVRMFEQLVVDDTPGTSPKFASCLHIGPQEWQRGQRWIADLKDRIVRGPQPLGRSPTAEQRLSHDLDDIFSTMVSRRHIVHLGSQPVHVDVDRKGRYTVSLDGREILRGTTEWKRKAQTGEGLVELLFSSKSTGAYRAIAVYGPRSFVDVVTPGERNPSPDELEILKSGIRPSSLFVKFARSTLRLAETFLEDGGSDVIVTYLEPHLRANVRRIHLDSATNAVADDALNWVVATLDAGGVYAILGQDRDLLDALVILGAMAPTMPYRTVLARELDAQGFTDPDRIIDALVQAGRNGGFPLVSTDGVEVLVQV
ncbi:hypothetical protein [Rugosimonospora africana]|uniref:Uncharacterized protein n=1 Tax=Rugosimonospora africana TaxID=556532 RepID=A0A8J3QTC0_9ACTN|nr:hypothetical protein [Rugosimonospora africana]GIH16109.1 hypothetical protein Raf01_42810 [Rugosimonospora africana]